jgi:hypothetical protein
MSAKMLSFAVILIDFSKPGPNEFRHRIPAIITDLAIISNNGIEPAPERKNAPPAEYRVERLDGVTRYFKSRAADAAFVATQSQPGGWTAGTHAMNCDSVFTNSARTCHHADPLARSVTDGRAILSLKVYLLKGTPLDLWDLIAKRERLGQA